MNSQITRIPRVKEKGNWTPIKDKLWIFSTGYIKEISTKKFVSKFCSYFKDDLEEQYFDQAENFSGLTICPLALVDHDGKVRYLISEIFSHLNSQFQAKINELNEGEDPEEMENEKTLEDQEDALEFKSLADLAISLPIRCFGAIIFKVRGAHFGDVTRIRKFLNDLDYCVFQEEMEIFHYKVCGLGLQHNCHQKCKPNQRMTLFFCDCEGG